MQDNQEDIQIEHKVYKKEKIKINKNVQENAYAFLNAESDLKFRLNFEPDCVTLEELVSNFSKV